MPAKEINLGVLLDEDDKEKRTAKTHCCRNRSE